MTCPNCGAQPEDGAAVCPECGALLTPEKKEQPSACGEWEETITFALRVLVHVLIWIFSLCILGFGLYKAYYWYQSSQLQKLYESGAIQMPQLEIIEMDDGRSGHAVTFFGSDGDVVYIEELARRYMIVGGKAVIRVADSEWFELVDSGASTAQIALTPVLISEDGDKTLLPVIAFTVEMPVSPLTIISPTEKYVETLSSVYELQMTVVYGSTVLVDGEDVTSMVDKQGNLTVNVAVYPRGENPVSILVQTPNHLETREDLVFYRQPMEIDLDLAPSTVFTSAVSAMTIRGSFDPAASFSVDTAYTPGSLTTDEEGNFSFIAEFDHIGYNTVTIRASKPGCADSVISFDIYYVPSINEYSRSAWKMDYQNVLYCWQEWDGRMFRCEGSIAAVLSSDPNTVVIDVSDDESGKYLVIENMSDLPISETGGRYLIWADISGQAEYNGKTYTRLIGRYAEKLN